jgi:molybdate transport system ATP-binding protein
MGKREAHDEALSMLDTFGIAHIKDRSPATISGGEAQRTALSRALVLKPKLLLMDEPFSALDPTTKTEMYQIMRSVHERFDCTIIFVTHDFNEAQLLADRIAILLDGTLRGVVEAKRLFEEEFDEEVLAFLGKEKSDEDQ